MAVPLKAGCIDMMEKCEVLVVGAGMAGLSAAARLSEAGINVVLIGLRKVLKRYI
jgi:monoamine oxidase